MFVQLLAIAAAAVSFVSAQNSTNFTIADVTQAFTAAKIVPDGTSHATRQVDGRNANGIIIAVLPAFNPTAILNVVFLDNTTGASVNVTPGENLTRERKFARLWSLGRVAERNCT